ncbi:MAG: phosphoribosylglycinamide formyltransferase [Bacteroidales bacterium]|jgi:phosphoribosylglycinamide formyltransferase-1|nr:phosphoribosylglycinamide formyltransferase [Bacteroidales bacterium]
MIRLALFASGSGTNVEQIAEYFQSNSEVRVEVVVVNKVDAFVRQRAAKLGIEDVYFNREDFYQSDKVLDCLIKRRIDWIVLAGFLWLVPQSLLSRYESKIINIHPALLPNYGGKGMYGHYVHEAVVANHETKTGITIHLVNKDYDKGKILFQAICNISEQDTANDVADRIHLLEKEHFPKVIAATIL